MICSEEGCNEEALYTYVWPWGQEGSCCGVHRVVVNQRSTQMLDRGELQFSVIDPNRPKEVSRDERARLRAEILVRDEDIASLKNQVAGLHSSQAKLADEARRLRAANNYLTNEAKHAAEALAKMTTERDQALADLADVTVDRDRLAVLARPTPLSEGAPTE